MRRRQAEEDRTPLAAHDMTTSVQVPPDEGGQQEGGEDGPPAKDTASSSCCSPETSALAGVIKLTTCAVAGVIFGLALEKGRVFEPEAIRNQMVFKQWTMMKMFLSAMATGQFLLAIVSVVPQWRPFFTHVTQGFCQTLADKGLLTSTLGPFLLGIGMTFSGACPGMVLAQVGSWTTNSVFTFLGALGGALLYGLVAPYVSKLTRPRKPFKYFTIQDQTGVFYAWIAIPISLVLFGAVVALEVVVPWQNDLPPWSRNPLNDTTNIMSLKAWPPTISGALIGVLQLLILFSVRDTLGGSSSYMTLVSQWVVPSKLKEMFPYLAKYRCGIDNWWQVFYVVSAMVGSLLSSHLSDSTGTTRGVGVPWALSGGFLLLVGARLASGCTSGHGLSGAGLLFWLSLLAVPAMFAGAIGSAFVLRGFGVLDEYVCSTGPCQDS